MNSNTSWTIITRIKGEPKSRVYKLENIPPDTSYEDIIKLTKEEIINSHPVLVLIPVKPLPDKGQPSGNDNTTDLTVA